MIIRMKLSVLSWFMLIILLVGCNNQQTLPSTPDLGIPIGEFNTRIRLMVPEGWNTYKINEVVGINVDNFSTDKIAFGYDYGARIFKLEDQKWIEIPNLEKYPEGYFILMPSQGNPLKQGAASVFPVLNDSKEAVTLRIVLIGNIYRDDQITDEQTAGYIDVRLTP